MLAVLIIHLKTRNPLLWKIHNKAFYILQTKDLFWLAFDVVVFIGVWILPMRAGLS